MSSSGSEGVFLVYVRLPEGAPMAFASRIVTSGYSRVSTRADVLYLSVVSTMAR